MYDKKLILISDGFIISYIIQYMDNLLYYRYFQILKILGKYLNEDYPFIYLFCCNSNLRSFASIKDAIFKRGSASIH